MRCSHPHYTLDLGVKENGKRNLKFIGFNPDLSSLRQLERRYGENNVVPLPCGECLNCRLNHSKEWAVRCVLESLSYDDNFFVTLTYDDAHLPKDGRLHREHIQEFFKKLRYYVGSFRYFGCGEYGSKTKRPHYHLILFGCHLTDLCSCGRGLYQSDIITKCWSHGFNYVGFVTYQSCNYVAMYTTKKIFGDQSDEFLMASNRPGIGATWCQEHLDKVLQYDAVFGDFGNGKAARLPRYFEKIAEALDGTRYLDLKKARLDKSQAIEINKMIVHEFENVEELLAYEGQCKLSEFIAKRKGQRL